MGREAIVEICGSETPLQLRQLIKTGRKGEIERSGTMYQGGHGQGHRRTRLEAIAEGRGLLVKSTGDDAEEYSKSEPQDKLEFTALKSISF